MTTALNIKKGERYNHALFGQVTVLEIKRNDGEKADRIKHLVRFKDKYGIEETQSINGFKLSLKS